MVSWKPLKKIKLKIKIDIYVNYINNRKELHYIALSDNRCGNKLILITDSIVLLVKNHSSKIDRYRYGKKKQIFTVIYLGLNQAHKLIFENDGALRTFIRKCFKKGKVIVISTALGIMIVLSGLENVNAMGLSPVPQAPIMRLDNRRMVSTKFLPRNVRLNIEKQDTISWLRPRELGIGIYLMDERFLRTPEVSSVIRKLRGGSWTTALIGNTILVLVWYGVWLLAGGTEASRNQPNPKDRMVFVESHEAVMLRRGQMQFKTKDHGALANLEFRIRKDGGTSTPITEENVDIFTDVVQDVIEDPTSIWFEDATYQGVTTREVKLVNIYNQEKNRVVIFKQSTRDFITFCEPTELETDIILERGNFGGELGWFKGPAKNLPPQVNAQQNVVNEMTPINTFESDVMGITLAPQFSPVDQNSGFTPVNSFESDVLGITPVDSSASDYQI